MRVVFYTPIDALSGGNIVMKIYAEYLAKNGHEVFIIAGAKENKEYKENGVTYKIFNKYLNNYIGNFLYLLPYIKNYYTLTPKCDVIIPVFFPLTIHALYAKQRKICKKVISLFQDNKNMFWFGKYIYQLLKIKSFVRQIDEIIAVSEPTGNEIFQYSGRKPIVIKNAIEKEYFYKRNTIKENYLLFVGSGKEKGLPIFLKAVESVREKYPEIKVKVIGGGKGILKNNIEYLPRITDKNSLAEIYSGALIYVNQSPSDSFGLPSLEAMACGTSVVLTDTVGSKDFARNGENAIVVPVNDYKATVDAIVKLLEDKALREHLEMNGLKTSQNYDWEQSCSSFLKIMVNNNSAL